MPAFICTACGMQYAPSDAPPTACPICEDERQYVPPGGQEWVTLEELRNSSSNAWRVLEPNLYEIVTTPAFAIGQRAQLLRTHAGNILLDCIALIDGATVDLINAMGGIKAIAISHPHYYTCMVEWSRAFGGVPIHLHKDDREWIYREDPAIKLWDGETKDLLPGLKLIRCGGHYPGGVVLHWAAGAGGNGALLSGDIVQVVQDRKTVSFMRSFPNFIPMSAPAVERVVKALEPFSFEVIHGAFSTRTIRKDGKRVLQKSAERYLNYIRGDGSAELK
jgi:glyoxylase-like metal-dependent hydrolase (beta-lactamase superfamily II)